MVRDDQLAGGGLVSGVILGLLVSGGCHLFGDHDVPTDIEEVPADTNVSDGATDTGEASDARDTGVDTAPPEDTSADGGDTEGMDAVDGSADTTDGGDDVADTTDASETEGGDADTGLPENQCPEGEPSYRIRPVQTTPMIDGNCSDAEFDHAKRLPVPPKMSSDGDSENTSDNEVDCWILWQSNQPARFHGCCEVEDDDLQANTKPGDPVTKMYGSGDYTPDDRLEFHRRCDMTPELGQCSYKTFFNNRKSPTSFSFETFGSGRESWEANMEGVAVTTTDGYDLEWAVDIGFSRDPGDIGLCNLTIFDVDEGPSYGQAITFGTETSINDPDEWGCCFYE